MPLSLNMVAIAMPLLTVSGYGNYSNCRIVTAPQSFYIQSSVEIL